MDPIKIHQTSLHAVLVLDAAHIDPASVATLISPNRDSVVVTFDQQQDSKPKDSTATTNTIKTTTQLTLCPLLVIPGSKTPEEAAPVELLGDCSFSVLPANLVVRFTKSRPVEWQALRIELQQRPSGESPQTHSMVHLAKFATASNAGKLQDAIQQSHLWPGIGESDARPQAVCNVQAKKEPGENSILLTAELVSRNGTGPHPAASTSAAGP